MTSTYKKIKNIIASGKHPIVRIKEPLFEEAYLEKGMLARVSSVSVKHGDENWIVFKVDEFKNHNIGFEIANYWSADKGCHCLTATEAGEYPVGGVEELSFDPKTLGDYLEVVEDNPLIEAWLAVSDGRSYVTWLEDKIHELTAGRPII